MKRIFFLLLLVFLSDLPERVSAQIYSENIVAYVDIELSGGFNLIGNPLIRSDLGINSVLPNLPDGASLTKWNATTQQFEEADTYFAGYGWVNSVLQISTTELGPYEGAFLQVSGPVQISLTGDVPEPLLESVLPLEQGFNLRCCPMFDTGGGFASCFSCGSIVPCEPFSDGDSVLFYNGDQQAYEEALTYFVGLGWLDATLTQVNPWPRPGQGFFLQHSAPSFPLTAESGSGIAGEASPAGEPGFLLLNPTRGIDEFTFEFFGEEEASYRVQSATMPGGWFDMSIVASPPGGGMITVTDTNATDSMRAYRVLK